MTAALRPMVPPSCPFDGASLPKQRAVFTVRFAGRGCLGRCGVPLRRECLARFRPAPSGRPRFVAAVCVMRARHIPSKSPWARLGRSRVQPNRGKTGAGRFSGPECSENRKIGTGPLLLRPPARAGGRFSNDWKKFRGVFQWLENGGREPKRPLAGSRCPRFSNREQRFSFCLRGGGRFGRMPP